MSSVVSTVFCCWLYYEFLYQSFVVLIMKITSRIVRPSLYIWTSDTSSMFSRVYPVAQLIMLISNRPFLTSEKYCTSATCSTVSSSQLLVCLVSTLGPTQQQLYVYVTSLRSSFVNDLENCKIWGKSMSHFTPRHPPPPPKNCHAYRHLHLSTEFKTRWYQISWIPLQQVQGLRHVGVPGQASHLALLQIDILKIFCLGLASECFWRRLPKLRTFRWNSFRCGSHSSPAPYLNIFQLRFRVWRLGQLPGWPAP
jgi:hypothetical protein